MHVVADRSTAPAAIRTDLGAIFVSLELKLRLVRPFDLYRPSVAFRERSASLVGPGRGSSISASRESTF
ncbi:hypothetical protein QN219_32740 [Sinorhizobium sp. 7-81]|uniref:hypothetical protein n=1 Tax=Sinorhizobium sp. 8-89 TaxID=3049089 RepID=UPI0024C2C0AF|nr:hypothetical protein [Sinorhizobium sp. 8-89]MDK1494683.1 hypothetical protein [Sinorhizobium sp. 8-89]